MQEKRGHAHAETETERATKRMENESKDHTEKNKILASMLKETELMGNRMYCVESGVERTVRG